MRLEDHLSEDEKKRLNKIRRRKHIKKRPVNNDPLKANENLSDNEYRRMMGEYRQTYKRGRGGAIKGK